MLGDTVFTDGDQESLCNTENEFEKHLTPFWKNKAPREVESFNFLYYFAAIHNI